jgi:glycine/D-amino acid oxidase-like deaminating enzyme|tara:strand:+ start:10420 stop:11529 length:1110 start_codon:yes stop_codon:yes gene_type:complete
MKKKEADFAIIGGGIVGLSVAHGLLKQGCSVICIDGSDTDFRASRGNFGLVWVQGKGIRTPFYAAWTQNAARIYPDFVSELSQETGVQINYNQAGGYEYFTDPHTLSQRMEEYKQLKKALNGDYPYEFLSSSQIRAAEPMIGGETIGASFYPYDGHLNPLQLLKALASYCQKKGLSHYLGEELKTADKKEGVFRLVTKKGLTISANKVVISAGLGAKKIGPLFGFLGLVSPQRGQILVTEKISPILNRPSVTIRQVDEGAIQIGDSQEQAGFNDNETQAQMSRIARNAIKVMPKLAQLRLVRAWGSLRVMSPDGLPIYHQSHTMPGAFLITCHSGITLAATHSTNLSLWLTGHKNAPELSGFSEDRFHA